MHAQLKPINLTKKHVAHFHEHTFLQTRIFKFVLNLFQPKLSSKNMALVFRQADSFQVDEENQANTLVSVAPLPQEPVDKPTINGESPPENGTNSPPTTNGHSANQTQVADTEM